MIRAPARGCWRAGPLGILELLGQALVLALAHRRQIAPLRPTGSLLIEIDRHLQLPAHPFAQLPGQFSAFLQGDARHRHERADVGGAHARMGALVGGHVQHLGGGLHALEGGLQHLPGGAHESHHGAVGVRPRIHIQQLDAGHRRDGVGDDLDLGQVTAFGKVGDALDDSLGHG